MHKKPLFIIQTERLGLRNWQNSDVQPFIEMNLDKEVRRYFPGLATPEQTKASIQRFKNHIDTHGYGFFAVEILDTEEFIGFVGLANTSYETHFTPCVEIGWRLKTDAWGKGFATEAAKACLEFGLSDLGLQTIYSFTATENKASEHIMKKLGMTFEGTFDHPKIDKKHPLCKHFLYCWRQISV